MKARWRGEIVTVVSVKNGKVQIARACGLRWVRSEELSKLHDAQREINAAWLATSDS